MPEAFRFHLVAAISWVLVSAVCADDTSTPTLPTRNELQSRRTEIYAELDRNVEAVKSCFDLLDVLPEDESDTRELLDQQIQQFDDRSNVLHDELNEIDRFEYLAEKKRSLEEEATTLEEEASQLQRTGHPVPAGLRQAKAQAIRRSLEDGSWKLLADEEWKCTPEVEDLVSVLQLDAEVDKLKSETQQLRHQLSALTARIEELERQLAVDRPSTDQNVKPPAPSLP